MKKQLLQAKKEQRRERIVQSTLDILCESGQASINLEDVVARAQTSKSAIYEIFGNKEGLLIAVADTVMFSSKGLFEQASSKEMTVTQFLMKYIEIYLHVAYSKEYIPVMRTINTKISESKVIGEYYLNTGTTSMISRLEAYLEEMVRREVLSIQNCKLAARQFLGSLMWFEKSSILCNSSLSLSKDELLEEHKIAVDAFVRAYSA